MEYIFPVNEPQDAVIPVRSLDQAMDWSLVLASQGLPATIQTADPEPGWRLLVPAQHYTPALRALRQFRIENREQRWVQPLPASGLMFDWRAAAWFLAFAILYLLQQSSSPAFTEAGLMSNRGVLDGQWWRLFTAVTLHADLPHLIANVTSGILLLGLVMGSRGSGWGVLASYLAGAGGNLAALMLHANQHQSLGASGMVMGSLGILAVESFRDIQSGAGRRRLALRGLMGGMLLLVLTGFSPGTDVVAHVGGFVSGALLGLALHALPEDRIESRNANRMAEILCLGAMILTWWLALRN